jgi:protein gp37
MNRTGIAWTEFTWNPITGCKHVSRACDNCYADKTAEDKRGTAAFPVGFDLRFWSDRLAEPGQRKKPALIFAGSMTDFFQVDVPDAWRDAVFDAIEATPQHTFQILTKRPARDPSRMTRRYTDRRRRHAHAEMLAEAPARIVKPDRLPSRPFSCVCHNPPRTFRDLDALVAHAEDGG